MYIFFVERALNYPLTNIGYQSCELYGVKSTTHFKDAPKKF